MGQFATVTTIPLVGILLLNLLGYCEMSIYPGLRRKPLQQNLQQPYEMSSDHLVQLMEENARRRLQQQFEQQLELINLQMNRQRQLERERQRQERYRQQAWDNSVEEADYDNSNDNANDIGNANSNNNNNNNNNQYDQYDSNPNGEFSYKYVNNEMNGDDMNGRIPFAVGPSDPRYYAEDNQVDQGNDDDDDDNNSLDNQTLDEYEEYVPAETNVVSSYQATPQSSAADVVAADSVVPERSAVLAPAPLENSKLLDNSAITTTFHRIKPQTAAAAAVAGVNLIPMKTLSAHNEDVAAAATNTRNDISALIEKLQKEGKSETILNSQDASIGHDVHAVVRQHLGMDGEMGMYLVALIAGVSAAITVGLIALGVAWYTLHNKTKAAADVEYPAYGVTGPNKDISPSGDRKLAQSAQMYHYQHQKQQIIAMENRQAAEGHCGLSDVESDDDNEEGDYTVYECPGLAPTGEMEVKNPLFLDETPVTPSSNAVAPSTSASATSASNTTQLTQATPQQPLVTRTATGKATTSMATSSDDNKNNKKTKK